MQPKIDWVDSLTFVTQGMLEVESSGVIVADWSNTNNSAASTSFLLDLLEDNSYLEIKKEKKKLFAWGPEIL